MHDTKAEALLAFVETSLAPEGLRRQIARARFSAEHTGSRRAQSGRARAARVEGAAPAPTPPSQALPDGEAALVGGGDDAVFDLHDDGLGVVDVRERAAGTDIAPVVWQRTDYPMGLAGWAEATARSHYDDGDGDESPDHDDDEPPATWLRRDGSGRFPDPCTQRTFDNARQRGIFTAILEHLKNAVASEARGETPPTLRGLCCGVAGTGKTFVMMFVKIFVNLAMNNNDATTTMAPTGAAAGNCGGTTADRALSFSRTAREYKNITNRKTLALLQERYENTKCIMKDEISMWGQLMFGVRPC